MPATAAEPVAARRILVYGVTGSGKTTMAERISRATSIPWHSVDDLTWRPGWTEVPHDEQRRRIEAICAREAWILDTAYARWLDVALARAEVYRGAGLPEMVLASALGAPDSDPRFGQATDLQREPGVVADVFSRNSIVAWHFRSFRRKRRRVASWVQQADGPAVLRFTRSRQAEAWLAGLASAGVQPNPGGPSR